MTSTDTLSQMLDRVAAYDAALHQWKAAHDRPRERTGDWLAEPTAAEQSLIDSFAADVRIARARLDLAVAAHAASLTADDLAAAQALTDAGSIW